MPFVVSPNHSELENRIKSQKIKNLILREGLIKPLSSEDLVK